MAQDIGVAIIDGKFEIIEKTKINANDIVLAAQKDPKKYPLLSSIDEYGDTYIQSIQGSYIIYELKDLQQVLDDENKSVTDQLINILQKAGENHRQVRFIGD